MKREGRVGDRPWPNKCRSIEPCTAILIPHLFVWSFERQCRFKCEAYVWYLCHPQLIVPLSFFNCLLSTDSLLISCHTGVSVQRGSCAWHTLSQKRTICILSREANTGSLKLHASCFSKMIPVMSCGLHACGRQNYNQGIKKNIYK